MKNTPDSPIPGKDVSMLQHYLEQCGLSSEGLEPPVPSVPVIEESAEPASEPITETPTPAPKRRASKEAPPAPSEPDKEGVRYSVRMRELPTEERPRERLIHYGADSLSTMELLAIILRTGTEQRSATSLAEHLLQTFNGLRGLARATIEEMASVHGIGTTKAAQIKAAIEFGKRLVAALPDERPKITSPRDVYNLIGTSLREEKREHFVALLLDTKNGVMRIRTVSIGDLSSSLVHPREVFTEAIRHSAASMIVAHNHPSGDPTPSSDDVAVTRRLQEAGELLGIELLDHIVLGDNRFVSLKEKGLM